MPYAIDMVEWLLKVPGDGAVRAINEGIPDRSIYIKDLYVNQKIISVCG